jgi:hypothetical protein
MDFTTKTRLPKEGKTKVKQESPSITLSDKLLRKNIIHPELQKAADITQNQYWRDILISASRGEFNRRLCYKGEYIMTKDGSSREYLDKSDIEDLAKTFIDFSKKYAKSLSEVDVQEQEDQRRKILDKPVVITWKYATKDLKRNLLIEYAEKISKKKNSKSKDQLLNVFLYALSWGILTDSVVELDENKIKKIDHVRYDKKTDVWSIDLDSMPPIDVKKSKRGAKKKNKLTIEEAWEETVKFYSDEDSDSKK